MEAKDVEPLRVSPSEAGPYIELLYSRVKEVKEALERYGVSYWMRENVISVNGGPKIAMLMLGRKGDAVAVQKILDELPKAELV